MFKLYRPWLQHRPRSLFYFQSRTISEQSSKHLSDVSKPQDGPRTDSSGRGTRPPSRYKYFFREQLKLANKQRSPGQRAITFADTEVTREIRARWDAMSEEEQFAATERIYQEELERAQDPEGSRLKLKTSRLVKRLRKEVPRGVEFAVMVISKTQKEPTVYHSSCAVQSFWRETYKTTLERTAERMRDYLYAKGVQNPKALDIDLDLDHIREMIDRLPRYGEVTGRVRPKYMPVYGSLPRRPDMEALTSQLMLSQLREAADRHIIRMEYRQFDEMITAKYGVTVTNWPPIRFTSPTEQPNMRDVLRLYLALKSGETKFRRLEPEEKKLWDETRERLRREYVERTGREPRRVVVSHAKPYADVLDTAVIGTIGQIEMFMLAPERAMEAWRTKTAS